MTRHLILRISSATSFLALLCMLSGVFGVSAYAATGATAGASAPNALQARLTPSIFRKQDALRLNPGQGVLPNQANQLLPCLESTTIPLCYSPQQIRGAYGVQGLLDKKITGKGRTIVIVDDYQSPTISTDLRLFDRIFNLPDPQLHIIAPYGLHPFDFRNSAAASFAGEISLDVEWSHALAPGATIDLVLGNPSDDSIRGEIDALIKATTYAVNNNLGGTLSLSVGAGETCYSSTEIRNWHYAFAKAEEKSISVFVSSGDSGSAVAICDKNGTPLTLAEGANYPASDPLVTSVGGTTLLAGRNGKYNSETTWNDTKIEPGSAAGGGGFSALFPRPSYQDGVPGTRAARGVPDVSYNADSLTGVPTVISSLLPGATLIVPAGGTSAGAPQWAGLVTLLDQYAGHRLGFLNEKLYHVGKCDTYTKAFHDITTGDNAFNFSDEQGKHVTIPGYRATPGWDAATGLGAPKGTGLAAVLA